MWGGTSRLPCTCRVIIVRVCLSHAAAFSFNIYCWKADEITERPMTHSDQQELSLNCSTIADPLKTVNWKQKQIFVVFFWLSSSSLYSNEGKWLSVVISPQDWEYMSSQGSTLTGRRNPLIKLCLRRHGIIIKGKIYIEGTWLTQTVYWYWLIDQPNSQNKC